MINVAICDDEPQEITNAQDLLIKYAHERPQYDIKTCSFIAPLELLSYVVEQGGFDVLLLDVYMAGMLGTDAARELRNMGDNCQIIFLTSSRDHAIDAFSVDAVHYLVKPYSENEFFSALEKVMDRLTKKEDVYITVKSSEGIRRVALNKLVYSETDNHVQKLYLSDGTVTSVRNSSIELFKLLEKEPRFYKCGSTYIINMDYIVELSSRIVAFSTGLKIPMLDRKYKDFKKRYMDYVCSL